MEELNGSIILLCPFPLIPVTSLAGLQPSVQAARLNPRLGNGFRHVREVLQRGIALIPPHRTRRDRSSYHVASLEDKSSAGWGRGGHHQRTEQTRVRQAASQERKPSTFIASRRRLESAGDTPRRICVVVCCFFVGVLSFLFSFDSV